MSAFPSIPFTYASDIEDEAERSVDRATDGTPIVREFWSGKGKFRVVFEQLTGTERDAIRAHRAAHALVAFDFDWGGTVYSCVYGEAPLKWKPEKPGLWGLVLELVAL